MRKRNLGDIIQTIVTVVIPFVSLCCFLGCQQQQVEKYRTETCTYHDYLVVTTFDGNDFRLSEDSNIILDDKVRVKDGEKLEITFDTNNTPQRTDDKIVNLKIILKE